MRHHFAHQKDAAPVAVAPPVAAPAEAHSNGEAGELVSKKEKRKKGEERDEIDTLFAGAEKKKSKKQK